MTYLVMGLTQGTGSTGGNDGNTRLLVQSEAANGSTTFTDSSVVGQTITVAGTVTHDTSRAKFGSSSIYFNNGTLNCSSSEFAVGFGDFTYDFWVNTSGWGTTGLFSNGEQGSPFGVHGPILYTNGGTSFTFAIGFSGSTADYGTVTLTPNVWHHIAFVRSSDYSAGAVDGVFVEPFASKSSENLSNTAMAIGGRYSSGSFPLTNTYIEEFRFSNTARWTSNFTPPTAPYA